MRQRRRHSRGGRPRAPQQGPGPGEASPREGADFAAGRGAAPLPPPESQPPAASDMLRGPQARRASPGAGLGVPNARSCIRLWLVLRRMRSGGVLGRGRGRGDTALLSAQSRAPGSLRGLGSDSRDILVVNGGAVDANRQQMSPHCGAVGAAARQGARTCRTSQGARRARAAVSSRFPTEILRPGDREGPPGWRVGSSWWGRPGWAETRPQGLGVAPGPTVAPPGAQPRGTPGTPQAAPLARASAPSALSSKQPAGRPLRTAKLDLPDSKGARGGAGTARTRSSGRDGGSGGCGQANRALLASCGLD